MLKLFKSLLFSVLFLSNAYGETFTWGGYTKLDISKNKVESILQNYVDKTYPGEVEQYNKQLDKIKKQKLEKVSHVSFVHNNLMWQDTLKNTTAKLNHLEAKNYCRNLVLAKRKDWRVPTYKELLTLVDYSKAQPASLERIQYINSSSYWSDTQKILKKKERLKTYWYVDFTQGTSRFSNEMEMKNIRCVRELSKKKDDY